MQSATQARGEGPEWGPDAVRARGRAAGCSSTPAVGTGSAGMGGKPRFGIGIRGFRALLLLTGLAASCVPAASGARCAFTSRGLDFNLAGMAKLR